MGAAKKFSHGHSPHVPTWNTLHLFWDPYFKQDIQSLEQIQRKGARFVTVNYSYQHSVTSMVDDLNWSPLEHRRKNKSLTTFH